MMKDSKLYSVFNNKCPRCHKGDFFVSNSAYNLRTFTKMHPHCSVCGESFDPEPGYYFGAMYVSYAINTIIMVAVWVACEVLVPEINIWLMVLYTIIAGLALTPLTFRWSRLGWINMFVKFRPSGKTSS